MRLLRVPTRIPIRLAGLPIVAAIVTLTAMPAISQSSDLESIREERRAAQAERAAQASEVDAATAELSEITEALDALTLEVAAQEAALAAAQRALAAAEAERDRAHAAIDELEADLVALQEQVSSRAIASFVNGGDSSAELLVTVGDPMDVVRMRSLIEEATGDDADLREDLRRVEEDLAIEKAAAEAAAAEAERLQAEEEERLAALSDAKAAQEVLMQQASERLDHMLADLAELQELESDLVARESAAVAALAAELAARGPISTNPIPIPPESEIVRVDVASGFRVHQSIKAQVEAMFEHAARDGIVLDAWGWRDPATQIRLRREHCGTSDYEVYEMPSYLCNPPTARPGASMHERGLALDITVNGAAISYQEQAAFRWLAEHAAAYGFYNLPSEPWHWSTNGS